MTFQGPSTLVSIGQWLRAEFYGANNGSPEDVETRRCKQRLNFRRSLPWLVWIIAVYIGGLLAQHAGAPIWLRGLIAVLLTPAMIAIGHLRMRELASADELQQRIAMQAMAFTFTATLCVMLTLALLHDIGIDLPIPPLIWFWLFFLTDILALRYFRWRY
ncbi:MAG TPA: hypothetical protein VFN09_10790 [Rhodanobacteraceae bacterium]|nr:hypothetical protein [Rhodanobacteraceae bacterium]